MKHGVPPTLLRAGRKRVLPAQAAGVDDDIRQWIDKVNSEQDTLTGAPSEEPSIVSQPVREVVTGYWGSPVPTDDAEEAEADFVNSIR